MEKETEIKVSLTKVFENDYQFKLKDSNPEIYFYIPKKEYEKFSKEFQLTGSQLIFTIQGTKLLKVKFDIFCYDEEWQKFYNEINEILSDVKIR